MGTTNNVDLLSSNATNGAHQIYENSLYAMPSNGCFTLFAKSLGTNVDFMVRLSQVGNPTATLIYNLDAGTVVYPQGTSGNDVNGDAWSFTKGILEKYKDGWYRIGFENLVSATASNVRITLKIIPRGSTIDHPVWTGTGQNDFALWGWQREDGQFPTSYIPIPAGSATTRAADVVSINGDNFGTYRTNEFDLNAVDMSGSVSALPIILQPYAALAPDGTFSAFKVSTSGTPANSNAGSLAFTPSAGAASGMPALNNNYRKSIYLKTVSGTGTISSIQKNHTINITNEWQRFEVQTNTGIANGATFYIVDFRVSGTTLDDSSKVNDSLVYFDSSSGTFKADATTTKLTLVDGGNF